MPLQGKDRFTRARESMVRNQLAEKGISDPRVLDAMTNIPRDEFVLSNNLREAYADTPLPIGYGQTISQPYIVALMTQCLELKGPEKVLEIGTGSGYQTAILCLLCDTVYSVEKHPELQERASRSLGQLGLHNVFLKTADGTNGWPEHAPYDGIIVTAGAPGLPPPLMEQLAVGGRLVIPVGDAFTQVLRKVIKTESGHDSADICGCRFVPLVGEYGWKE